MFGEAQVLSQLNHPAIIRLQDCGFAHPAGRARPYLAMDYFEGATLEEVVEQEGPLSDRDALAVVWQLAAGLQAAHAKNVLHRDVKPGNVLLRRDGDEWEVKLIDFGLAVRHAGAQALAASAGTLAGGRIAGTIDYAAPEQMGRLPGVGVSPRSDVYGLGRTCCYALFGTPSPLGSHWDRITRTFRNFLEPCLADRPQDRPANMDEALALLQKAKAKRQPSSRSTPGPPTPAPPTPPAPPQVGEAEALLAALRRGYEPAMMDRLGALLHWLGQHAPGERTAGLLAQARAMLEGAARQAGPALRPTGPLQAAPAPRAASALSWQVRLSLRDLAARPH